MLLDDGTPLAEMIDAVIRAKLRGGGATKEDVEDCETWVRETVTNAAVLNLLFRGALDIAEFDLTGQPVTRHSEQGELLMEQLARGEGLEILP